MNDTEKIVDQCEASGAHRLLVTSVLNRAGMSKQASETPSEKRGRKYADAVHELWPINTPEEVVESAASVELQRDKLASGRHSRVQDQINKAAALHQRLDQVHYARARVASERRPTNDETKIASQVKYAMPEAGAYPCHDREHTQRSVDTFWAHRLNYPLPWRKQAANKLLSAADEHQASLSEQQRHDLEQTAGRGYNQPDEPARQMAHRAMKIGHRNPQLASQMLKQACHLVQQTDRDDPSQLRQHLDKVARVLDEVDDRYGLRPLYETGELLEPEQAVYAHTPTKVAHIKDALVTVGDCVYKRADVAQLKAAAFHGADRSLTDQLAGIDGYVQPHKLASVAKQADPDVLNRVMSGFGVRPVQRQSGRRQANVVMNEELQNWARVANDYGSDFDMQGNEGFFTLNGGSDMPIGQDMGNGLYGSAYNKAASAAADSYDPEQLLEAVRTRGGQEVPWSDLKSDPKTKVAADQLHRQGLIIDHGDSLSLTTAGLAHQPPEPEPTRPAGLVPA